MHCWAHARVREFSYAPPKCLIQIVVVRTIASKRREVGIGNEGAKDGKISKLDDLARTGKPPFMRHTFEAPRLKEQGYELQAVATDDDKDGNQFVVTITLSAKLKAAFAAA